MHNLNLTAFHPTTSLPLSHSFPLRRCSLIDKSQKKSNAHFTISPSSCHSNPVSKHSQRSEHQRSHHPSFILTSVSSAVIAAAAFCNCDWKPQNSHPQTDHHSTNVAVVDNYFNRHVTPLSSESSPVNTVIAVNRKNSTATDGTIPTTLLVGNENPALKKKCKEWPHPRTSLSSQLPNSVSITANQHLISQLYQNESEHSSHHSHSSSPVPSSNSTSSASTSASTLPSPPETKLEIPEKQGQSSTPTQSNWEHHLEQKQEDSSTLSLQSKSKSESTYEEKQVEKEQHQSPSPSSYETNVAVLSEIPKSIQRRATSNAAKAAIRFRRPATMGLCGGIAITSTSLYLKHRRNLISDNSLSSPTSEQLVHDACTVVCMHIPFCVSERTSLLHNLDNLINSTGICADAASLAQASRRAAIVVENEAVTGVLEDSRKFAPHVDVFIAQSFQEAERRFKAHVAIEGEKVEKLLQPFSSKTILTNSNNKKLQQQQQDQNRKGLKSDYGVVTMVVATLEGVDLKCYDENYTNLQKLRYALEAIARVKEGEITGLELLWAPEHAADGGLNRMQMMDSYPSLRIK